MTHPEAIRYIIFDLGGVVLEWNPEAIIREATDDPEEQRILLHEVFSDPEWAELDRGSLTEAEAIARFAQRTNQSVASMATVMRVGDRSMRPIPDTLTLMRELRARGFPLYLLSNLPVERYAYLRDKYDFWDQFEGIVISGHLKMIKPYPGIYEYLLTSYDLEPSACLFLDDSPPNVEGARAVGIQSLVFTDADACRKELAELLNGG